MFLYSVGMIYFQNSFYRKFRSWMKLLVILLAIVTLKAQSRIDGQIVDKETGEPVEGAIVKFQTKTQAFLEGWPWNTFATTYTDAQGTAVKDVPLISYLNEQT